MYERYVAPALAQHLPALPYAAGLIGQGSDVLGFDTARSTDHDWGPRLQIVVAEDDRAARAEEILAVVDAALPETVCGVPIDLPGAMQEPGGPTNHHNSARGRTHGVTVTSVSELLLDLIGTAKDPRQWDAARWLTTPRQGLVEFTAGPVHRDDTGELTAARVALAWYPRDIWLYVMSGRWQRIAQIEAFVGRTAEAGDDLGSQVLAGQIAWDIMHLALLQRQTYAPYAKWLGTAFRRHEDGDELTEPLTTALSTPSAEVRQKALVEALLVLSRRHDHLQLTPPLDSQAEMFFGRPYPVIWSERIARALHDAIRDPQVAALGFGLGGIDEITNGTDALKNTSLRQGVAAAHTLRAKLPVPSGWVPVGETSQ